MRSPNSKSATPELRRKVRAALRSAGLTLAALAADAEQVILFGSCAVGCGRPGSDVDLLCVGTGPRLDTGRLHLLWIEAACLEDPRWLASEMGGHVARYGIWLVGERTLGAPQPPSARTLEKKRRRIIERATVLGSKWSVLSERFKREQLRRLRLDVQRLRLLKRGEPVVPNPLLDLAWEEGGGRLETLDRMIPSEPEVAKALRGVTGLARAMAGRTPPHGKLPSLLRS